MDCFVDAYFAGLWQDPSCVKSRTGSAICIANCLVIWSSKLQPDTAMSTMEAEYNAFSMEMKSVLSLLTVLEVVRMGVGMSNQQPTTPFGRIMLGHSP